MFRGSWVPRVEQVCCCFFSLSFSHSLSVPHCLSILSQCVLPLISPACGPGEGGKSDIANRQDVKVLPPVCEQLQKPEDRSLLQEVLCHYHLTWMIKIIIKILFFKCYV